jgi:hypothetical protein
MNEATDMTKYPFARAAKALRDFASAYDASFERSNAKQMDAKASIRDRNAQRG